MSPRTYMGSLMCLVTKLTISALRKGPTFCWKPYMLITKFSLILKYVGECLHLTGMRLVEHGSVGFGCIKLDSVG